MKQIILTFILTVLTFSKPVSACLYNPPAPPAPNWQGLEACAGALDSRIVITSTIIFSIMVVTFLLIARLKKAKSPQIKK